MSSWVRAAAIALAVAVGSAACQEVPAAAQAPRPAYGSGGAGHPAWRPAMARPA